MRPWEAGFGSESDWEKLWRDQVSGAKMTETNRNSARTCRQQTLSLLDAARTHASLEPQPIALLRRSTNLQAFWSRIRLGKAVAGPGVRGQDDRDKWKETSFFQRQRLAPKVRPWEACFGSELDWGKLWRDQVFGAKMTETNGNKLVFF